VDRERLMLAQIPPTLTTYTVSSTVLQETWDFLRERGGKEVEAVVLWAGIVNDASTATVLAAIPPAQIAYRSEEGLAVEVPQEALSKLLVALPLGVHILVRVHSHPTDAFHSTLDDTNMLISHDRAISIVVPDFARGPVALSSCSVNELRNPGGWIELSAAAVRERFRIT
jgi:hypothetical protein